MEAAHALQAAHRIDPGRIAKIEVRTFAEAAALAVAAPRTTEEAQYSLPFPLAVLLLRGAVDAASIAPPDLFDPAVLQLAARVSLVADPAFSRRFPAERLAQASLTLDDGAVLLSAPTPARGDAADPLPDAELAAKFRRLAERLPPGRRRRIEQEVAALDQGGSVPALLDLILSAA